MYVYLFQFLVSASEMHQKSFFFALFSAINESQKKVLMKYFDAINDGTFLSDEQLVKKYFSRTNNVRELFQNFLDAFGPV